MSSSDVSSVTSHFPYPNEGFTTTTSGSVSAGATSVGLNSTSGLTNGKVFVGIIEPGTASEQTFTGTVDTSGSQITNVVWTRGSNVGHGGGVTVVDYVTGTGQKMVSKGILVQHNQDGTHGAVTATSLTASGAVSAATLASTGNTTVGGALSVTGTTSFTGAVTLPASTVVATKESNPYKFSVYRNAAYTPANGATIAFDTKDFDTGSNVDIVTNKGRFTAPIAGFYLFQTTLAYSINGNAGTGYSAKFKKNGSGIDQGSNMVNEFSGAYTQSCNATCFLQLAANDYIEVFSDNNGATPLIPGPSSTNFRGFLVSAT